MPNVKEVMFQDPLSYQMLITHSLHDYVMLILLVIVGLVMVVLADVYVSASLANYFLDYPALEVAWTVLPGCVLISIAGPSLWLLYLSDEMQSPGLSISVVGHQWFWEYAVPEHGVSAYESYMLSDESPRLLGGSSRLTLPLGVMSRVLVTSSDVIHSWAVPSVGAKVDAVPGRLNQLSVLSSLVGVMYGQCSEVCGANHSFMPIVLEVVPVSVWLNWTNC